MADNITGRLSGEGNTKNEKEVSMVSCSDLNNLLKERQERDEKGAIVPADKFVGCLSVTDDCLNVADDGLIVADDSLSVTDHCLNVADDGR